MSKAMSSRVVFHNAGAAATKLPAPNPSQPQDMNWQELTSNDFGAIDRGHRPFCCLWRQSNNTDPTCRWRPTG